MMTVNGVTSPLSSRSSSSPSSPPLNCYSGLKDDDFAGWYAVSSKSQCNDFCFWMHPSSNNNNNSTISNTIDNPHKTTISSSNSKWVCILQSASDETTWENAFYDNNTNNNIQVFHDVNIHTFDYLRCNRGAGEQLYSNGQVVMKSIIFWSFAMIICVTFFMIQIICQYKRSKRRKFIEETMTSFDNELKMEDNHFESIQTDHMNQSTNQNTILRKPCTIKKMCIVILVVSINVVVLYILFTAILVIIEIDQKVILPSSLQSLTPSCSSNELRCPAANDPIDNPSLTSMQSSDMKPFSYIIASDSQLDWYDGESAYMGTLNYPPPCTSMDSCESCTAKLSTYTNQQMKKSIESLIDGNVVLQYSNDTTIQESNRPIPKTLVLNGDLTQYFHRRERERYESIYHNIQGLEQFFPGLGNHDYDQKNGATYNNDEWVGPNYCNGKHALSYFRGAFCNQIPKFNAATRLTRYDPKSLSYSWEEGRYHFVQVHYHPLFENAGLGISSSIEWLKRDLHLAYESNLTSVLYVHASSWLPDILKRTFVDNNVAIIFTGHIHRCLGNRCELLRSLNSHQAEVYFNSTHELNYNETNIVYDNVEKCFPSRASLCSKNAYGANGLFYLNNMKSGLMLPDRKLVSKVPKKNGLCPAIPYEPYINKTDNTLLCRRQSIPAHYPFQEQENENDSRSIPIFFSGSASFQTLLVADFYSDRIVINAMTANEGKEGSRYIDVNTVPNAVYPFHTSEDLDEKVIYI